MGEKSNFDPEGPRVVIGAHDPSYEHYMELFPDILNEWKRKGWKGIAVWHSGNVTGRAFVLKKDHYPSEEEGKGSEKEDMPTSVCTVEARITASTAEGHDEL